MINLKTVVKSLGCETVFFVFLFCCHLLLLSNAISLERPNRANALMFVQGGPTSSNLTSTFSTRSSSSRFPEESSFNESVREMANKMSYQMSVSSRFGFFVKGRMQVGVTFRF